ncbi:GNAT family N-acetyltransferase [Streptomyces sp. NPDC096538]|uniref:GNAT family N-acetyltransferase n=1 Tax=Streptomyces sp. NPDC096538 TaxID=3155427 RepID=UPI003326A557
MTAYPGIIPGTVLFGLLDADGDVQAVFYGPTDPPPDPHPALPRAGRRPRPPADRLGHPLAGVSADHATATAAAFAEAWQWHTAARPTLRVGMHSYRLGTLTPPGPPPPGLGRPAAGPGHERLMPWCRELAADFGESVTIDAAFGAPHPLRRKALHLIRDPGRHPVSMAGLNPLIAGMVRLGPVHTPHHLRGHGYGAAVTAEVSRAALATGATEVVLYTNAANPTSSALHQRLGHGRVTDWAPYGFTYAEA